MRKAGMIFLLSTVIILFGSCYNVEGTIFCPEWATLDSGRCDFAVQVSNIFGRGSSETRVIWSDMREWVAVKIEVFDDYLILTTSGKLAVRELSSGQLLDNSVPLVIKPGNYVLTKSVRSAPAEFTLINPNTSAVNVTITFIRPHQP